MWKAFIVWISDNYIRTAEASLVGTSYVFGLKTGIDFTDFSLESGLNF